MNTFKFYLCTLFLFIGIQQSFSTIVSEVDPVYKKAMETTLIKLDSAKTVGAYQACRNQFERIGTKYSEQWLPAYYVAYSDIQMVFMNPKGENNESVLMDAKKQIDKLSLFQNVDQSELNTLLGYYFNALIMLNPEVNGQKYFNDVILSYRKAIEQDATNPRPVFLLTFFDGNLPAFLQSVKNPCEEYKKARILYEQQDAANISKPYWGRAFFEQVSAQCK